MTDYLGSTLPEQLVVWGLFQRCVGALSFLALMQLLPQALALGGSGGISPVAAKLNQIKRDYPGWRKLVLFPSLLWINSSDKFIRGIIILGCLGSLWSIYGGEWSGFGLAAAWFALLSMDLVVGLTYPWDCLLFEMGFLCFLLPPIKALPNVDAITLPFEPVAWAFRLLLFRVVFGFGKFKFSQLNFKDAGYFKAFMVNIPLPGYGSWYLYRFPDWFFRAILIFAFVVEILAPPFIFVPGIPRLIVAACIILLMLGIQAICSFGYFNIATIVLCIPLLDFRSTVINMELQSFIQPWSNAFLSLLLLLLITGWTLAFIFNSWCTFTWLHWPSALQVRSKLIRNLLSFYRLIIRFRVIHSFGVFPPKSSPPIKWAPVFEGSEDNEIWRPFEYKFFISTEFSAPKMAAPYHPRLDHAIFYEGYGTNGSSFLSSTVGAGDPYEFTHGLGTELIVQRLLEGNKATYSLFTGNNFKPEQPPIYVRIMYYSFRPTSIAEQKATGRWWTKEQVGIHLPSTRLNSEIVQKLQSQPELFHWDNVFWRSWSPSIQRLQKASISSSAEALVRLASQGLKSQICDVFWNEYLPVLYIDGVPDWTGMPKMVSKFEKREGYRALKDLEIFWSRLSIILAEKLLDKFINKKPPFELIDNYFIFGLFIHHIIAQGKEAVVNVLDNPNAACTYYSAFSQEDAFITYASFRLHALKFMSNKLRLTLKFSDDISKTKGLPGFARLITFTSTLFKDEHVEHHPDMYCDPKNGKWYINNEPV